MKPELKAIGVDSVCQTCQHFQTIEHRTLYRCNKQSFRKVDAGKCPEKMPWANARVTK